MKKLIIFFFCILLIFSLIGLNKKKSPDNNNDITINISDSKKFSEAEINAAIECLKNDIIVPEAILTKISYDEEKSNEAIKNYSKYGQGSWDGITEENTIVLLSDFHIDDSGNNLIIMPISEFEDYVWMLTRETETSHWKIDAWGF